jgi:hypothetical protein
MNNLFYIRKDKAFSCWMTCFSFQVEKKYASTSPIKNVSQNSIFSPQCLIKPVHKFTSRKLEQQLKLREVKVPIINRQCVVHKFQCDLCDADYIGFTARISTNALLNISHQLLVNTFANPMEIRIYLMKVSFTCWGNARTNLIVSSMKCFT